MSDIRAWSSTAANNNQSPPDGWPEGQLPATVNDCAREDMAAVRRWYERAQWIDYGHTPTRTANNIFTVVNDQTTTYQVGRRIWCEDSSNLFGSIISSSFGSGVTTVTVRLDSGVLTSSLVRVSVGIISSINTSAPNISPFSNYRTLTGTYSVVAGDRGSYFDCTSGTFTVTLPAANVSTSTNPAWVLTIGNSGSGTITVSRAGSDTIDGANSFTLTQYQVVTLQSNGSNAWRRVSSFGV